MMNKDPQFVFNLIAGFSALVALSFVIGALFAAGRDIYLDGTKETHRMLNEILAELKKGGAEKDANKKD